jgi:hypothetical protein
MKKRKKGFIVKSQSVKEISMKRVVLFCFLLSSVAFASSVKGAAVQNFTVSGKELTVTVVNQSDKPITGYDIRVDITLPDGQPMFHEFTELYPVGKSLAAHESVIKTFDLGVESAVVKARLIVAIYSNSTAEAEKQEKLDQILLMRRNALKDLKLSPEEFNAYVNVRRLP